ncbi:hypothetical protein B7P43_G03221 [Cryptotermes secundus]|uniref:Uncharacterized protein n=1 Tax=Cryptotermes secundus TaxID=105785 RepID=A0A2J7RS12_9NEOP|nr:hypothetical protein B7P43_G03221 [Cryptotermes secundus]
MNLLHVSAKLGLDVHPDKGDYTFMSHRNEGENQNIKVQIFGNDTEEIKITFIKN